MKKVLLGAILMAFVLILNSCTLANSRIEMLNNSSEDKKADARMEQVIEVTKNQDKESLKNLFSTKALDEAVNIDAGIDYLMNLMEGEIISWERDTLSSHESIEYGKKSEFIRSWYTVTTNVGVYDFFFLDYTVDTINPDNAGLYALRAVKAEDREKHFTYAQDMAIAGIYIPEE